MINPPKSYLDKVIVFLRVFEDAKLSFKKGSFCYKDLMLEKSKVVYLVLLERTGSVLSVSAWKLLVASVEAILDSFVFLTSS